MIKVNYSVNFLTHVVQPGDNYYKLAKQYNSAVCSIMAANPTVNPNYIYYGQRICIPVQAPYGNVATYQQKNTIASPESLYKILESMEEERGIIELITDWIRPYSELYNQYISSSDSIERLSSKITNAKNEEMRYMETLPQNLNVLELENIQKEIEKIGKEVIELYDYRKWFVFFTNLMTPAAKKTASTFNLDKLPIINELIDGLSIMSTNIESGQTGKVTKLLSQSTELAQDINKKLAEKYTSMGEEEAVKNLEEKLEGIEGWKQQVIDVYNKNKEEYMAECEKLKKQYAELLRECKGKSIEPEKKNSPVVPEEKAIDVSGKWDTTWGEMILNQSGENVTGTYTWDDGKIVGVLNGNVMTGTWSEKPSYSPPKDAGVVEFTFSPNSFTGKWAYGDEQPTGTWEGKRI